VFTLVLSLPHMLGFAQGVTLKASDSCLGHSCLDPGRDSLGKLDSVPSKMCLA
jgi:hypothetical protein